LITVAILGGDSLPKKGANFLETILIVHILE